MNPVLSRTRVQDDADESEECAIDTAYGKHLAASHKIWHARLKG